MEITMLGTGNALVTECYNTCFVLHEGAESFLVDGGGGNGVLSQLKRAGLDWKDMRTIFVTHKHVDHILGIVWMVRMICQNMSQGKYEGEAVIYGHDEAIALVKDMAEKLLQEKQTKFIGDRLHLIPVADGETKEILGKQVTFFDIHSTKAKQFGFTTILNNGKRLTCAGDEPYNPGCRPYVEGSQWLLHEAFCLYRDRERFQPYEKHHSTVKEACELATELQIPNLVVWHTEDKQIARRKELYTAEGNEYYSGNLLVPDDQEIIDL